MIQSGETEKTQQQPGGPQGALPEECLRIYAGIDLDAIRYNLENMKANLVPGTTIIAVIKSDGYGHGSVPIALELEPFDYVWGFAVATAEEAFELRSAGIGKPILVLGYTFPYSYERMIRQGIRPSVFRLDTLEQLIACAQNKVLEKARIHIKVDTGMNRIGIRPDESGMEFVERALASDKVEVEGIFTHFARADETDKNPTLRQLQSFVKFLDRIEARFGVRIPVRHCSNSAGIVELEQANLDAVRAGIALYGLWPSGEVSRENVPLRPALSLVSRIVYIKEVGPGEEISYGGTYMTKEPTRIATLPVGYGDGYPRSLSNRGSVLIRGCRAPILGRICMDQFMVDVTRIPEAREGDPTVLIGTDGAQSITMEELGELSGRFNYELACDLNKRVPRLYFKQGRNVGTKDYFHRF